MSQLGTKKSRKGCKRCKQRRVKCDEEAPCSNCIRRNEECSLLEPTPSGSSDITDPALPSTSEEWTQDLELMHHYSTHTQIHRENVQYVWRDYIPQQALKHNFLMHGLLALAALHLAFLHPESSSRYLGLCDKHQTRALEKFRTILSSSIDPELAEALFALSATLSVSSIARSCAVSDTEAMDMDSISEIFFLTRGVADVVNMYYEHIHAGPMAVMFENAAFPTGTEVALPTPVSAQFAAVRQMLDGYGLDPEALTHCQSAWNDLENIYRNIAYFGPVAAIEHGQVFRWMIEVSPTYVRLVQARNPPALIVLAYFAAAMTSIRQAWYVQNWVEYALRGISRVIDADMQHWLDWPRQQVHERMSVLGVRSREDEPGWPTPFLAIVS